MTFCLIIILLLLYNKFSGIDTSMNLKKYVIWASSIMVLLSSLRHEGVGNDTLAYMNHFENFSMSWTEIWQLFIPKYITPGPWGKDPGIDVFDKLLSYVLPNGRLYIFFVSLLTISSVGYFIYDNAKNLRGACFSFIFYAMMFYQYAPNSAIRQSLAIALLLVAYSLLKRRKMLWFIIMVLLASTFHRSALAGFAMLALSYINNIKTIYILCIFGFVVTLTMPSLIAGYLGGDSEVYGDYVNSTFYQNTSRPYMVILLIVALFILSCLILARDVNVENNRLLYHGSALVLLFTPLIWVDPTAIRLIGYFGICMSLLIGNEIQVIPNYKNIYKGLIFVFLFKVAITPDNYHFMWQEMKLHDRYTYAQPPTHNNVDFNKTYIL